MSFNENETNLDTQNNSFDNQGGLGDASYEQPDYSDFGNSLDVSEQPTYYRKDNGLVKKILTFVVIIIAILLLIWLFKSMFSSGNKKLEVSIPNVIYEGENVEFITGVLDSDKVYIYSYSSSDNSIAEFEYSTLVSTDTANTLMPKRDGKVNIKIEALENGKKRGTYENEVVVCKSFASTAFPNSTYKVGAGSEVSLNLDLGLENACYTNLKYSSSNESVAVVSNKGVVTGVKAGTAVITVDNGYKTISKKVTVVAKSSVSSVTGVKLSTTNLTIYEGKTAFLTATVSPSNATNKAVTWTSSNESVAMVSSKGKVIGIAPGSAVITVTTQEGQKSAMAKVTVKKSTTSGGSTGGTSSGSTVKKVSSISINESSFALKINGVKQLSYKLLPTNATNKTVSWKSSNAGVAKVSSSGKVTAVGAGSAVISVTANDGSGASDSIVVTVASNDIVKVQTLTLSKSSVTINVGQSSSVKATISPSNSTNKTVSWESLNTSVATVSAGGTITGVKAGTTTVYAKIDGLVKSVSVTVRANTVDSGDGGQEECTTCECLGNCEEEPKNVEVESINVAPESFVLKVGETDFITAYVFPVDATDSEVSYRSNNTSVVRVDSFGNVTAVGVGNTFITVSAGGQSVAVDVTVQAVGTKPSCSVTMTKSNGDTYSSGYWTQFDVSVALSCSNATSTSISSSTGLNSTYTKNATVSKEGKHTITFTATNDFGTTTITKYVYLDKTDPVLTLTPTTLSHTSSFKVELSCSDALSGIKDGGKVLTKPDGTELTSYFTLKESGTVKGKCVDKAGNVVSVSRKYTISSGSSSGTSYKYCYYLNSEAIEYGCTSQGNTVTVVSSCNSSTWSSSGVYVYAGSAGANKCYGKRCMRRNLTTNSSTSGCLSYSN